ncbi:Mfg1p Ecym_6460 [Eremothecium cymbalariae DBVPG|uniref:Morphogenetic regulator of filamentous growth protein 1 n=1 Tax=Eremothecium cymbalariae (strain CBS 270.75 / DBVPG 7215 / KCTC 17166 / NRRL Y-17582) TaxID=931890 RepID=G8JUQ1_ERECY|nr:hypothetical protein Ecym_6460 [Eremothecium cymbalariae DBVPG\
MNKYKNMNIPQQQHWAQQQHQTQQVRGAPAFQNQSNTIQNKYQMLPSGNNSQTPANSQMNLMSGQHRYMIPPPFGNMQFATQQRQSPQQVQQQQQTNFHMQPQLDQPQLQPQPQQGGPSLSQSQQFTYPNLSRRFPMSHMLSSYQVRKYLSNMAILRAHEVVNQINLSMGRIDDYEYWDKFANDIFTPNGILRYARKNGDDTRLFEFVMPIIPSLLKFLGSTGVVRIEVVPQQLRVQVLSNGTIFFEYPRCTVTYFYPDGSYMTNFSQIKGIFDATLKIEWCDICTYSFVPGIEWNSLERVISDHKVSYEIFQALSDPNATPNLGVDENKDYSVNKADVQQVPPNFNAITQLRSQFKVFHNISSFGIHESLMRVLQVNDVMSYLKNLKVYQKLNNIQSPLESLSSFIAASEDGRSSVPESNKSPISNPNTNGVMNNMAQAMVNPQPQTPSSVSFISTMAYNPVTNKQQERKSATKRASGDALSPLTIDDSAQSPSDAVDGDNASHPYKRMKF